MGLYYEAGDKIPIVLVDRMTSFQSGDWIVTKGSRI